MIKEKKVTITYNGYRSQHETLAAIAEKKDIPISQLYREMILQYLKKNDPKAK